jgi:CRP-like cAMP-binding protein
MDSKRSFLFKLIRKNSFFKEFNDKEIIQIIDKNGIFKKFDKKNLKIINEDAPCKSLFILLEGEVNVVRKNYKHEITKSVILARLEKGSVFGEISLISKRKRISSVITNTNLTVVLEITEENIKGFDANTQSKIYQQAIETLVERLDKINAEK